MEIEQNTISRDWIIIHKGRKFYVNFTESDGQTLALCNRDNWEISEETDEGVEENIGYMMDNAAAGQKDKAEKDAGIIEQLIKFCIENWDNQFMQELRQELDDQVELLK